MKNALLLWLFPATLVAQEKQTVWEPELKNKSVADRFFYYDSRADYVVTGQITAVQMSAQIDDFGTNRGTCTIKVSQVVKRTDLQNPSAIRANDIISFDFVTYSDTKSPSDKIKKGSILMFPLRQVKSIDTEYQLIEASASIFDINPDLLSACMRSTWFVDSLGRYTDGVSRVRYMQTTERSPGKTVSRIKVFDQQNHLVYESWKTMKGKCAQAFETLLMNGDARILCAPDWVVQVWYDSRGKARKKEKRRGTMADFHV